MTDLHDAATRFDRDGFVIVRCLFDAASLSEIETQLTRFVVHTAPDLPPDEAYFEDGAPGVLKSAFRLNHHDTFFDALRVSPRIVEIVSTVFDDPNVVPWHVMFFAKAAGSGSETPPHQDNAFQNMQPPEGLTATIALDLSTPDNGVLCCQAGSHKCGLLPHVPSGVPGFSRRLADPLVTAQYPPEQLCMVPGDVAFHHLNTVHYSGDNTSANSRRQIGIGYYSSRAERDEAAFAAYQDEVADLHQDKLGIPAAEGQ